MKTTFRTYATIVACMLSFSAFAQKKKTTDSTTVIIFNSGSTSTPKKASGESNIVKIAPLGLISGQFPLLYERSITSFLSVQVGGGLTHRNYLRSAWAGEQDIKYTYPTGTADDYYDEAEALYSFDFRKPEMGYMATVQPRFYFESDGLEGQFVGLSFDMYQYKFSIPGAVDKGGSISFTGAPKQEHENVRDFMVHFGGQQLFDHLTLEYSSAVGLRGINGKKYVARTTGSGIEDGFATYKQNVLSFGFGVKLGYHF